MASDFAAIERAQEMLDRRSASHEQFEAESSTSHKEPPPHMDDGPPPRGSPEEGTAPPLEIPAVSTWAVKEPRPREWTWADWIPKRRVTMLSGDGGVGKTLLAQIVGSAVGSGVDLYGIATDSGPVLGIFCEDELDELIRRQRDICSALSVRMEALSNVHFESRVGEDNLLVTYHEKRAMPTAFYQRIDSTCAMIKPVLVIVDTASDTFGGNMLEQIEVRQYVQFILGGLCARHGCAVLLNAHPSAAGIQSGDGGGFSVAWNNTVRSRLYLAHPKAAHGVSDPTRVVLSRKKANYAAKGEELHFKFTNGVWALDLDPPAIAERALKPHEIEAYAVLLELGEGSHVKLANWTAECVRRGILKADTDDAREKAFERITKSLLGAGMVSKGQGMKGFYRAIRVVDGEPTSEPTK